MSRTKSDLLMVAVPNPDRRVYVEAAQLLVRVLGAKAPDVATLVLHELRDRKSKAIAEEYLYFIGWYDPKNARPRGRKQGTGRRHNQPGRRPVTNKSPRELLRRIATSSQPSDPSRN